MGSNGGYDLRPQDHPFGDEDLRFDQFQSFDCGIVHLVQIGHGYTLEELLFALLLQLVGRTIFPVSRLLTISMSVRSSFLDDVLRN